MTPTTVLLTSVAAIVVLAAAVRSTWSPCGLSMLSTITPIGEAGKGHSYRSTAAWFIVGATVGGTILGGVMALLAVATRSLHLHPTTLELSALLAAAVAAISDAGITSLRLPVHRRQVNERWLDRYRPWVYGAGFGWQIGTGLATYITTAAVYLMIVLGALTTVPLAGFLLGTLFGLLRGLAVLLTRRQTSPVALLEFHRRFTLAGAKVGKVVVVVEMGTLAALAAALGSPLAGVSMAALALAVASAAALRTRRARSSSSHSGDAGGDGVALLPPLADSAQRLVLSGHRGPDRLAWSRQDLSRPLDTASGSRPPTASPSDPWAQPPGSLSG